MSLTRDQEQKLLAAVGRIDDLENEIVNLRKYVNVLESRAESYTNNLVPIALKSNTETLTENKILLNSDYVVQYLDPGGANRTVTMPAESERNHMFILVNAADAAEELNVENVATTSIIDIGQNEQAILVSDGSSWQVLGTSTPDELSVGSNFDAGSGTLFVDSVNNRVGVNTTSPSYALHVSSGNVRITSSEAVALMSYYADSATAWHSALFRAERSRNGGLVSDGDALFSIEGKGHDGTNVELAAKIKMEVDGTPGNDDMPGRIVFMTTPDGSNTVTERMRIDSGGGLKLKEMAAAGADTATFGQLWVKNTTPCELWFTDDAGTDTKLA